MWVNKAATERLAGAGTKPYFDSGIDSLTLPALARITSGLAVTGLRGLWPGRSIAEGTRAAFFPGPNQRTTVPGRHGHTH
jgi:hypothetical protein